MKKYTWIVVLSLFSTSMANAAVNDAWYLSADTGVSYPYSSGNVNSYLNPGFGWPNDQYIISNVSVKPLVAVSAGYAWNLEKARNPLSFYSLGLFYAYIPATVNGFIDIFSLPGFRNYSYQYDVTQQELMGVFKTDIYRWKYFMPYVALRAGISINKGSDYFEPALANITPRDTPGFKNSSTTNFSFMLGGGVNFILKNNLWLELEYDYGSFGYVKTGDAETIYLGQHLQNKLHANMVLFGVNYFI